MENDSISVFYTKDFYFVSVLTKGVLCAKFALPPPSLGGGGVLVLYIAFPSHIKMHYFTSHKEKKWHCFLLLLLFRFDSLEDNIS